MARSIIMCIAIVLCLIYSTPGYSQDNRKWDLSVSDQLTLSNQSLLNQVAVQGSCRFHPHWAARLGYGFSSGATGQTGKIHETWAGISSIVKTPSPQIELLATFGAGVLWDDFSQNTTIPKGMAVVEAEFRWYCLPHGFVGFNVRSQLAQGLRMLRLPGVIIGITF